MKTCTRCGEAQPYTNFYKQKKAKDGYGYYCKSCSRAYNRSRDTEDGARVLAWQRANKEKHLAWKRQWAKNNRDKKNAEQAKYRASKKGATPAWLGEDHHFIMKEIYALSQLRSEMTNVLHHVDHIIPLSGVEVCGLHVPWNLQVIPATENLSKGNK